MAEGLILEFEGVGREEYEAVNGRLGIEMESGEGDWPAGLLFHAGGAKPVAGVPVDYRDGGTESDLRIYACGRRRNSRFLAR